MDLVTISRSLNPADAQLIRARLEAAGFHAVVVNELAALCFEGYALGTGGITGGLVGDFLAILAGHLAVEDQRNVQLRRHFRDEGLLAQNERLERV